MDDFEILFGQITILYNSRISEMFLTFKVTWRKIQITDIKIIEIPIFSFQQNKVDSLWL